MYATEEQVIGALKEYGAGIKNQRILAALERAFMEMNVTDFYLLAGELQVQVAPKGGIQINFPRREHPTRWQRRHPTTKGQQYVSGPTKAKVQLVIGEDKVEQWSEQKISNELTKAFRRICRYTLRRQGQRNAAGYV